MSVFSAEVFEDQNSYSFPDPSLSDTCEFQVSLKHLCGTYLSNMSAGSVVPVVGTSPILI